MITEEIDKVLIVSFIPYFLERDCFWFEDNLADILRARKTQSFWPDNTLFLEKGEKINLSQLLRKLDELGYEKVFRVQEPGEFSQRGGVVDVFPINMRFAVRLDFLGSKIETLQKLNIEIKDEKISREFLKKKLKSQKMFFDLKILKKGDFLVHLDHGIGRFSGIEKFQVQNHKFQTPKECRHPAEQASSRLQSSEFKTDYYVLEYAGNDKLYVPVGLERKLSRYIGFRDPKISRLGSGLWQRTKRKIKSEVEKLAKELLKTFAQKQIAKRPPYERKEIAEILESTFAYSLTPDQIKAVKDVSRDLEEEKPMDRLICGDVGFGKTEIALRAAVRAAENNRQAAVICPTTILAYQHFRTFKERLKELPLRTELLSRLKKRKEQLDLLLSLSRGEIDILIGTHRVLSQDVYFKDLGLLIIDDEQKFGVKHKEKLRELKPEIDVLSLSATPIPRTLYMALSSLKELSLIQTPPSGRKPIKTYILPFKKETVKKAIERELKRGGQIFFLHNRIETILAFKKSLERLKTDAKIEILHAKLKEKEIIRIMAAFEKKEFNLLLSTTIIENGLDIPNVNTLIVDNALRLGLSQAYQLRGRIGRGNVRAHAYFLYPKRLIGEKAGKRLKALQGARELGAGYQIALKDMEIRGAGNILGKEQSGAVNKIGLNLYCQMLSLAVERLKMSKNNYFAKI